jgi:anthraniloyl-CoA monooxygenase
VRITSIGGGPGGLYAAILMKAADPSHEITVFERNADDTFGFGVVFSAATLAGLETADAVSFHRLWDASARWDPVEVRHAGQRIRAHGNRFAAISRHRLLRILQERAAELGVDLRFGSEVGDVEAVMRDADLVLGADGINSAVRQRFAAHFQPRLRTEGSKFIWLGTTHPFDAFTFIFEQNEAGRFQAHIYPFSEQMSTFIVECHPDTWRKAGLDAVDAAQLAPGESDEASIRYLEELFADHLEGHSTWLDWTTVSNEAWHHDNVVLLGDSAHTAHFSIGSGTKLAMEDAMALADALALHDDLGEVLDAYVSDRKPVTEAIQRAAGESLEWFERYGRYWSFEAPQFAYSLLTRSKRVDYENLRKRDRELVDNLDRWYAGACRNGPAPAVPQPPASNPVRVGPVVLPNRIAHVTDADRAGHDGVPSDAHLADLAAWARADVGLVLADAVSVSPTGRISPTDAGIWDDAHVERWRTALPPPGADDGAARVGVRLVHAGPRGATRTRDHGVDLPLSSAQAWPLVAASAQPYSTIARTPAELDADGMAAIRADFVAAARRAAEAGFDAVELHAGHGYLLASFLSPLTNTRDDAFGGDVFGRLRFPLEVLDAVRAVWPEDRLLSVCVGASDLEPGGLTTTDALEIARQLRQHGADLLHVVSGQTTPRSRPDFATGFNAEWSDLVRNEATGPVMTSGNLPSVADIHHVVLGGRADLAALGRPLPPTPDWLS